MRQLTVLPDETETPDLSDDPLLSGIDSQRLNLLPYMGHSRNVQWGQYLTPIGVARFMASLSDISAPSICLLDAGAGIGALFGAEVSALCHRENPPEQVHVIAYEIDPAFIPYLTATVEQCRVMCQKVGIRFTADIRNTDFIEEAVTLLRGGLFSSDVIPTVNTAFLNPPYGKIRSSSRHRKLLQDVGIETSNLYTGFLGLAIQLLQPQGELIAITPRSFCNGPYFRPFRRQFLAVMRLQRLHLFDSREAAFGDDGVLQENLILRAIKAERDKSAEPYYPVVITTSENPNDSLLTQRVVAYDEVVYPGDPEAFIHIIPDGIGHSIRTMAASLPSTLESTGLSVSTGRVVEFRARDLLRHQDEPGAVPLIHPSHIKRGQVEWPGEKSRRPIAIVADQRSEALLLPNQNYVLVKRFTSKEEPRRVVAAVYQGQKHDVQLVGFENHLNYFHQDGHGLSLTLACGLAAFLNSTLVDASFRLFNGHTQVNATDLRNMRYPLVSQLEAIGRQIGNGISEQDILDSIVARELNLMEDSGTSNPVVAKQRIDEASTILSLLGMPTSQQNERSALTLLALLELTPDMPWSEAGSPLMGITPMMDFFAQHYGKHYAPNTRETVRRGTIHQFLDAGLVVINSDDPARPTNSGLTVYQIERSALELLRTFRTDEWENSLATYQESVEALKTKYAQERQQARIPITIAPDEMITLSQGGQNVLVEKVISGFLRQFLPHGRILYLGDTSDKFAYFRADDLARLGVTIDLHGKMPDIVIHEPEKNWLVLVEAVTSHGPIDPKRKEELARLFGSAQCDLVFVTAFLTRRAMVRFLGDISWETDVWVAESPTHLIHFNGDRFLGPVKESD
jgi:adenine-specific DNA-methyltransferase